MASSHFSGITLLVERDHWHNTYSFLLLLSLFFIVFIFSPLPSLPYPPLLPSPVKIILPIY